MTTVLTIFPFGQPARIRSLASDPAGFGRDRNEAGQIDRTPAWSRLRENAGSLPSSVSVRQRRQSSRSASMGNSREAGPFASTTHHGLSRRVRTDSVQCCVLTQVADRHQSESTGGGDRLWYRRGWRQRPAEIRLLPSIGRGCSYTWCRGCAGRDLCQFVASKCA